MIYVDINDIRQEYRRAMSAEDPNAHVLENLESIELRDNCKLIGTWDGRWWSMDGIEFPDEESLFWFRLKWR